MINIRKILRTIFLIIFLVCVGVLAKLLLIDSYVADKSTAEVRSIYHGEDALQENKFDTLFKLNNEIKGWIFISNTRIDYPVVQKENDSKYYLTHDYKNESSRYGSIFIDSRCKAGTDSKNIILHGHHMRDGQMFADLMKFSDVEFYKSNPIVEFDTPEENSIWKIISVLKLNTLEEQGEPFRYIIPEFEGSSDFISFVEEVKKRSLLDIPVDVKETDKLLTLSTCSYEFKDFRTVVIARKLRNGESGAIDVQNAKKASNPLMPDCWYKRYGGSPPS